LQLRNFAADSSCCLTQGLDKVRSCSVCCLVTGLLVTANASHELACLRCYCKLRVSATVAPQKPDSYSRYCHKVQMRATAMCSPRAFWSSRLRSARTHAHSRTHSKWLQMCRMLTGARFDVESACLQVLIRTISTVRAHFGCACCRA